MQCVGGLAMHIFSLRARLGIIDVTNEEMHVLLGAYLKTYLME